MLNQCRTFATVRLEMTTESKLLQLKTMANLQGVLQVPNSIQNRFRIHLVSIQRSTAFHTLSVIICFFSYIDIESAPLPAQQNCLISKPSQRQTIIWNRCECTTTQPSPWRELAGTGGRRRPRWTSASWAQQKLRSSIDILHDLLCLLYF